MDKEELFLCIPGVPESGIVYHSGVSVIRGRMQLCNIIESGKNNDWLYKPRIFTFPEMQEVCDTEITIVVRDE